MTCDEDTGSGDCHDLMVERIRYFTGRHMTARDFRDGDAYHRSFRHLHNRVLHGWGIACGLEVELHPLPHCRKDRVVVRCGLALDCCGREVVVREDVVAPRMPWDTRPTTKDGGCADFDYVLLLCLQYCETLTEKVPVLYSPQACSSPSMQEGRIREGYALCWHWVRRDELVKYGWNLPEGCAPDDDAPEKPGRGSPTESDRTDDCNGDAKPPRHPDGQYPCPEDAPPPPRCCLDPDCPPDHCVPLAVILAKCREEMGAQDDIDTSGRRSIAQAREHLTHICWINWPHGGVVRVGALQSLKVRFARPLLKSEFPHRPGPRGINERTFVAQYGEQLDNVQLEDLDFVEFRKPPYLTDDRRMAVYEIRKPYTYRNHVIHVTLRCDFLVDCHKNPVDGDHLCGRLPSGNGVPGGTFESWFRVVDDVEYDKIMKSDCAAQTADAQE